MKSMLILISRCFRGDERVNIYKMKIYEMSMIIYNYTT